MYDEKPHYRLKALLLQHYGKQYVAARALGIRDDELSAMIMARRPLPEDLLTELERELGVARAEFLTTRSGHKKQK